MLFKELSYSEIALVVFLSDFICYKDCVLRTNGNSKGNPLTVQDLAKLSGLKYDTIRRTIYSLRDKEILGFHVTGSGETETKMITVNPYIFCRGKKISAWVVDFYSKTKWAKMVREKVATKSRRVKS